MRLRPMMGAAPLTEPIMIGEFGNPLHFRVLAQNRASSRYPTYCPAKPTPNMNPCRHSRRSSASPPATKTEVVLAYCCCVGSLALGTSSIKFEMPLPCAAMTLVIVSVNRCDHSTSPE